MSMSTEGKGHVVVMGSTGSGKTTRDNGGPGKTGPGMRAKGQQMTQIFLAKSDASQIKALYSGENGERLAEAIRNNCSVWFAQNSGGWGKMPKLLSISLYAVKWLAWLLTYTVILPAAWLMLLIVLLFRLDNTTPGKLLAQETASVTRDVGSGEYHLFFCRDEPAPFIPALAKGKSTADSAPVAPSAICQKQVSVITDAEGYAAHIDGSLSVFKQLWVVMAVVFAGLALLMKRHPCFCLNDRMRSAHFRYSTPASRPAFAPDAIKTPDNKKEDDHE